MLSPSDPAKPGQKLYKPPLINLSTGSLTGVLPQHLKQVKDSGGWWRRLGNNPATKPGASIEDSILYEQNIYINNPLVSSCFVLCCKSSRELQLYSDMSVERTAGVP